MIAPSDHPTISWSPAVQAFLPHLLDRFQLDSGSIHGPSHWLRVLAIGRKLTAAVGISPRVVEYFALLHDLCRVNDGRDPDHGPRAARFAQDHQREWIDLADLEFQQLLHAITHHTRGQMHEDPVIQSCWDADRLDLGRVGIRPDTQWLGTKAAHDPAMIAWAWQQSRAAFQESAHPWVG